MLRESVSAFGRYSVRYGATSFDQTIDNVRMIDMDDDDNVDVLSASYGNAFGGDAAVVLYENDGSQSFTNLIIATSTQQVEYFAVTGEDVDGDGDAGLGVDL